MKLLLQKYFRLLPVLVLLSAVVITVNAQSIYIPDPVFANWLSNNGYSTCMSGWFLDTTCTAVKQTTTLTCESAGITDLTGVQGFTNLTRLDCSNNLLQQLPDLSGIKTLQQLQCSGNRLTSLSNNTASYIWCDHNQLSGTLHIPAATRVMYAQANPLSIIDASAALALGALACDSNYLLTSIINLPDTLTQLLCTNCAHLHVFDALMPANLQTFYCDGDSSIGSLPHMQASVRNLTCNYTAINALPASLPDSIWVLKCANNNISTLPPLPGDLYWLECSYNPIPVMPPLPQSMNALECIANKLTSLPALPAYLYDLQADYNQIPVLPALPQQMVVLSCSYDTVLTTLPALPKGMVDLYCNNCALTGLPSLPDSLSEFAVNNNPDLTCLPLLTKIRVFYFDSTGIQCVPNRIAVEYSVPDISLLPLCDSINPWGCTTDTGLVWPGDADNNGYVDNADLLPIGIAYGDSDVKRPDATINWVGQNCDNWADSLATGINYKYIDCNGDGIINADDTLAIRQNFSLVHPRGGGQGADSTSAVLAAVITIDTVYNGDTLHAVIILGDSAIPAKNVYGLAFDIQFDNKVIDSSYMQLHFSNSWLGNSNELLSMSWYFATEGLIRTAITRMDHHSRSGFGPIGIADFLITTSNINGKDLSFYKAILNTATVTMLDSAGNALAAKTVRDSAQIGYYPDTTTLSVQQLQLNNAVKVFPNPANNMVTICTANYVIDYIKIADLSGGEVLTFLPAGSKRAQLDISHLANGVYFAEIKTGDIKVNKRIVVAR